MTIYKNIKYGNSYKEFSNYDKRRFKDLIVFIANDYNIDLENYFKMSNYSDKEAILSILVKKRINIHLRHKMRFKGI